jgi:hypothetical protein
MIKWIKIGDLVYQNIEPKTIDEDGNEIWNIPSDLEKLRSCTIDTLNWLIGQSVKTTTGGQDITKLSAANSKAVVLVTKLIESLNPDTSALTTKEQEIYDKMKLLAQSGYADSDLLLRSLDSVFEAIQQYSALVDEAVKAQSVDELIEILEKV